MLQFLIYASLFSSELFVQESSAYQNAVLIKHMLRRVKFVLTIMINN